MLKLIFLVPSDLAHPTMRKGAEQKAIPSRRLGPTHCFHFETVCINVSFCEGRKDTALLHAAPNSRSLIIVSSFLVYIYVRTYM